MTNPKANNEEKEVLEKYLVQFLNIEKRFPLLPGIENEGVLAGLMGLSEDELINIRQKFEENARRAAVELLENEEVNNWLDDLPFKGDETIVALGDSLTDDLQGWFSILQYVLEITVPEADFTFINSGISYDTSTDALKRLNRDVLNHNPDWVIVALGTFDMQHLHVAPDRPLISMADFWENISTIEEAAEEIAKNPIVWITPPPVLSKMIEETRLFNFNIKEADLKGIREILSGKKGYIVDPLGNRMGDEGPEAWNYLSDGLHPSLSGHSHTVKEILRHLTQTEDPREGAELDLPNDFDNQ